MIFDFSFKKEILLPNILLTNFCNQNCPYCFAREEMKNSKIKEMSLENFKKLVKFLKKNDIETLRLMGGEPTIHSQFERIIQIGLENFEEILIFSNGLIPDKNKKLIEKNIQKFAFNFNIDTPGFEKSAKKRKQIIKTIKQFCSKTKVNIGFTLSGLKKDYKKLLQSFDNETLKKVGMRFGFAKALVGKKPFFAKKDYQKLGQKILKLVKFFKAKGIKDIFLDCGLKKEMFNRKGLKFLQKNTHIKGWGCQGKWSSFDIAPELTVFSCFPYYKKSKLRLKDSNFRKIGKSLKEKKHDCSW